MDVAAVLDTLGIELEDERHNRLVARCPFTSHEHDEDSPGFSVFKDTGHWICFKGCGSGTLTQLVAKVEDISDALALKIVRSQGLVYSESQMDSCFPINSEYQGKVLDNLRTDYFSQSVLKTSQYIIDRGFTRSTLGTWGFRYDEKLNAIVIPTYDFTGRHVVGVTRREVPGYPLMHKYMHHPDFEKQRYLYGAHHYQAGDGVVTIVEGQLDCAWLHQCGVTSVVSILGLYVSKSQETLISRLGHRVLLALDNDSAGREASLRLEFQLRERFEVDVLVWPKDGADAQDFSEAEIHDIFNERRYVWEGR